MPSRRATIPGPRQGRTILWACPSHRPNGRHHRRIRHRRIRHRTNHLRTNHPRTNHPRTTRLSTIPLRTTLRRTTRSQVRLFPESADLSAESGSALSGAAAVPASRASPARSCGAIARPHWQRGWNSGLNTTNTWPRAWPNEWRSSPPRMPQSFGSRPSWPTVRRPPRGAAADGSPRWPSSRWSWASRSPASAATQVDPSVVGVAVSWAGIVGVNWVHARSLRKRQVAPPPELVPTAE